MRLFTVSLAILTAFTLSACASKSSSSSSQDANAQSTEAASAAATTASAGAAATTDAGQTGGIPNYPGATASYSATSGGSSGTVMTTDDSFDKVYAWYQQHLPAGSEKMHTTAPVQSAAFTVGSSTDTTSVTITASDGKTTISIGHQKT